MRELLTDLEIKLLQTYADYNMHIHPTAQAIYYNPRTIYGIFARIWERTGCNPREFWGLMEIMQQLEKDGVNGREE